MELQSDQDLEEFLRQSHQNPVVVFKHSTQCSRSADALDELDAFMSDNDAVPCGMLAVIESRGLSDQVESRFNIRHESPQAIVILNGAAVWHASHWKVTAAALQDAVEQARGEARCPTN